MTQDLVVQFKKFGFGRECFLAMDFFHGGFFWVACATATDTKKGVTTHAHPGTGMPLENAFGTPSYGRASSAVSKRNYQFRVNSG
jgi:hypothetical protein